jgi:hypothetical protein
MICAVVIVCAALYALSASDDALATRALAALCGLAAMAAVALVLTWRPRGVATLEADRDERAEDFLEKLERGQEAIPDKETE